MATETSSEMVICPFCGATVAMGRTRCPSCHDDVSSVTGPKPAPVRRPNYWLLIWMCGTTLWAGVTVVMMSYVNAFGLDLWRLEDVALHTEHVRAKKLLLLIGMLLIPVVLFAIGWAVQRTVRRQDR